MSASSASGLASIGVAIAVDERDGRIEQPLERLLRAARGRQRSTASRLLRRRSPRAAARVQIGAVVLLERRRHGAPRARPCAATRQPDSDSSAATRPAVGRVQHAHVQRVQLGLHREDEQRADDVRRDQRRHRLDEVRVHRHQRGIDRPDAGEFLEQRPDQFRGAPGCSSTSARASVTPRGCAGSRARGRRAPGSAVL